MQKIQAISLKTGQVLLALYFILSGLAKFADWQTHIDLMARHNIPFADPLLFIAGIANLALGGHQGGATYETLFAQAELTQSNVENFLDAKPLLSSVL